MSRLYIYSFDLIYVQAWSRPYIRSFDLLYVQVDLIYLTLDLIYQILTIYLKTDFCPIWRVIVEPQSVTEASSVASQNASRKRTYG